MSRISKITISNYCKIEAIDCHVNGNHLVISGKNRQGKTSFLNGVWSTLESRGKREIPKPINEGADKAATVLVLDDGTTATRKYRRNDKGDCTTSISITHSDGSREKNPAKLLANWIDSNSLNLSLFIEDRPQDQIDQVLRVCGVTSPVEQVKQITGEEFSSQYGESAYAYLHRLSADETGVFFDRRRTEGRTLKQKQGALHEQREVVDDLGGELRGAESARDPSAIVERIQELQRQVESRRTIKSAYEQAKTELDNMLAQQDRLQNEHDEIEHQIKQLRERQSKIAVKLDETRDAAKTKGETVQALCAQFEGMADPTDALETAKADLDATKSDGKAEHDRRAATEQLDRLDDEFKASNRRHIRLEEILDALRELRRHLLDDADLGVKGLSIGDGELLLGGVPYVQIATSQKIDVAAEIVFRQNPKIKLVRVDDAEHLDAESRKRLLEKADQFGWQVFMAVVSDKPFKLEIVPAQIEEGVAA